MVAPITKHINNAQITKILEEIDDLKLKNPPLLVGEPLIKSGQARIRELQEETTLTGRLVDPNPITSRLLKTAPKNETTKATGAERAGG